MNRAPVQGDYSWTVALEGFLQLPRLDRLKVIRAGVLCLVTADECYLRAFPPVPRLYAAGVRYREDVIGFERWKNVGEVMVAGAGDCKDLAAWRCAELHCLGEPTATIQIDEYPDARASGPDFHVLVVRADGSTEDPSRVLGMP